MFNIVNVVFIAMEHLLEVLKILDGAVNADRNKVVAYAEQLAGKLESKGDARSAESVRRIVRNGKARELAPSRFSPLLPVDGESRLALADERSYSPQDLHVVLDERTAARVAEFIRHLRASDELIANGVGIAPSLLVFGPPGCGKTALARHIAAELQLPLLTARTDALISSYLGSTAKNLRTLFQHAMARPCVLFLDEFDAVAKLRDDQHELGELKRVVVSLLENIDALDNNTILIAATNHDHLLDRAIWRRFAFRLEMGLPSLEVRVALLKQFLSKHTPPSIDLHELAVATDGMSGAEIRHFCEGVRRNAILNKQTTIPEGDLLKGLLLHRVPNLEMISLRDQLTSARDLNTKLFTMRRLAELFSISLGKVSSLLNKKDAST